MPAATGDAADDRLADRHGRADGGPGRDRCARVRQQVEAGEPLYHLDRDLIARLQPDLVIAQDLCRVCAVPSGDISSALEALGLSCDVLSLDPQDLQGVLESIEQVGVAAGVADRAIELRRQLEARLAAIATSVPSGGRRPRVLGLEWPDPPFVGGHWIPDMVTAAGGTPLLASSGSPSRECSWREIADAAPDTVVFMPCGYDLGGAMALGGKLLETLRRECGANHTAIVAVEASAYFSRPGPRLVEGVAILAEVLHPGSDIGAPPGSWAPVG